MQESFNRPDEGSGGEYQPETPEGGPESAWGQPEPGAGAESASEGQPDAYGQQPAEASAAWSPESAYPSAASGDPSWPPPEPQAYAAPEPPAYAAPEPQAYAAPEPPAYAVTEPQAYIAPEPQTMTYAEQPSPPQTGPDQQPTYAQPQAYGDQQAAYDAQQAYAQQQYAQQAYAQQQYPQQYDPQAYAQQPQYAQQPYDQQAYAQQQYDQQAYAQQQYAQQQYAQQQYPPQQPGYGQAPTYYDPANQQAYGQAPYGQQPGYAAQPQPQPYAYGAAQAPWPAEPNYWEGQPTGYGRSFLATLSGFLLLAWGLFFFANGVLALYLGNLSDILQKTGVSPEIQASLDDIFKDPVAGGIVAVVGLLCFVGAVGIWTHRGWGRAIGIVLGLLGTLAGIGLVVSSMDITIGDTTIVGQLGDDDSALAFAIFALVTSLFVLLSMFMGRRHFRRRGVVS